MDTASPVPAETPGSAINADERVYLVARLVLIGILVGLFALGVVGPPGAVRGDLYVFALLLVVVDTLVLWWLASRARTSVADALMIVLAPDLVAIAIFAYLGGAGDAFYAVALMLPIVYALLVRRRSAWIVGVATGLAYFVGRLAAGPEPTVGYVLLAGKALTFPLVALLVSNSVHKRRLEEQGAREHALEAERLATALQRRVDEMQAVSEITEIVHSSLEFENVGTLVLDVLGKTIAVEECCLFIIDKQSSETLFSASRGSTPRLSSPIIAGGSAIFEDAHLVCIPVFDHGSTMVLFCAPGSDIARLSEEQRLVLGAVASELAVASENSRLFKLTQHLATTDELTGLANYRQLQQRLDAEVARATRYEKHLSLLMLDADDFKGFNDAFGHIAGDRALADMGAILGSCLREVDLSARYGGEEFAVVLPETDASGAYVVAEKVREAIESHLFGDEAEGRTSHLSVSVGLATFPTHADSKETLLREADDALYRAKSGGKNRIRSPLGAGIAQDDRVLPLSSDDTEWTGA